MIGSRTAQGLERFNRSARVGMIRRWANGDGCRTGTCLPGCAPWPLCVACWAIRGHGSWRWNGGKKRHVALWAQVLWVLRPTIPVGAKPGVRRLAHLPGRGSPPRRVPELRERETRAVEVAGRQCLPRQALCVLRKPALPDCHDRARCQGTAPALGVGQNLGDAVQARATAPGGDTGAPSESPRFRSARRTPTELW